jgi:hypothetical protein
MCVLRLVALAALLCPASSFLYGQAVKGSLLGTVTDTSGAVVPDANVTVTETTTNIARSAPTNATGNYSFPNLDPGVYRVRVEREGFRASVREGVDVLVNSTVRADFQLTLGAVAETLTIVDEAPMLQTDRSDTGRKIEARQLSDMPLLFNRNFQGLVALVPGAGRPFRAHSEFFNPQDSLSARVNGQSRYANNVQVEGIDNNYRPGTLNILIPPIEALATVDVTTSNFEAELGRVGGAVTNVTLRSGTNDYHGSLFAFNRVSATAARNVFAQRKANTVYNQFGFTFGGPIKRNKTFFFGDYQGTRDIRGDVNRVTIPTMAARSGDLREWNSVIYDPLTGDSEGRNRTPFQDKIIPANRISPISAKLLTFLPPPTFSGLQTNYEGLTSRDKRINSFDVKVDHQFNSSNNAAIRYSYQKSRTFDPSLFGEYGGFKDSGLGANPVHGGAINFTHIFNPSFIVDSRFGFSRYMNVTRQPDFGSNVSRELGIPGVNLGDDLTSGLTGISISGYGRVLGWAAAVPWRRGETNFNWISNWSKMAGNHTLKWGVDVRRNRGDALIGVFSPRGAWTFGNGPTSRNGDNVTTTGNAMGSFLLDLATASVRDVPTQYSSIRNTPLFSYFQDKWQVTPRLTIDMGIRQELYFPHTPRKPGGFSNYNPENNTLEQAGIGSVPLNLGRKMYWTNITPRFGVAFRPNEKTVLRGGYGISTIPLSILDTNGWAFNFPVFQNQTLTSANSFSPVGSLRTGYPAPLLAAIPEDGIIRNAPAQNFFAVPRDFKEPYLQSWNMAVQRALPHKFVVEVAYVGNHAVGVQTRANLNAGLVPGAGAAGQPLNQRFGNRATITSWIRAGNVYHSLQAKFDRRFSNGFLLTTAYTYSKAIDFTNDNEEPANYINFRSNRARSDEDRTHMFVQSYIYELPFGPKGRWLRSGIGRWILGDWQVNGIFTAQTGAPLNLTFSATTLNAPSNANRPNISGKPEILGKTGPGELWFDITKFSAPATATFGSAGRNILNGPGYVNLDFSAFRKFPVREKLSLELRAESFNFTNTPHFNNPNTTFGTGGFGQITTAVQDQRQLQFGLKLVF